MQIVIYIKTDPVYTPTVKKAISLQIIYILLQKLVQGPLLVVYWIDQEFSPDSGNVVQGFVDVIKIWAKVKLAASCKQIFHNEGWAKILRLISEFGTHPNQAAWESRKPISIITFWLRRSHIMMHVLHSNNVQGNHKRKPEERWEKNRVRWWTFYCLLLIKSLYVFIVWAAIKHHFCL